MRSASRRDLIRYAALAALVTVAMAALVVIANVRADRDVVALIAPGTKGAATEVIRHDFPDYHQHVGPGQDGQAFYAIARAPMHPRSDAPYLDRPRYRMQRILMPALAWAVHPGGGGRGLVLALFAWAVAGVALTAFASAAMVRLLGGSDRNARFVAVVVPLLPGAILAMNLTLPDALALGLALGAMVLDGSGARRWALAAAVLAVLARESMLVLLLGWALQGGWPALRRLVVVPALVAGAWWLTLLAVLSSTPNHIGEFAPLVGLVRSANAWVHGHGTVGGLACAVSVAVGIVALTRAGLRSPLGPVIALQLGLLSLLSTDVLSSDLNGSRASLPLLVVGLIALAVPAPAARTSKSNAAATAPT